MNTEKILTALFLILILALIYIYSLSKRLRKCKKEMENLYTLQQSRLDIDSKTLKITYCLAYSKRDMTRIERIETIKQYFAIDDYNTPGFEHLSWRHDLAKQGFRNIRITEL